MAKQKNKVILLAGPQGSGNHLWSKVFAMHPDVSGWNDLLDTSDPNNYFIRHYMEPSADIWENIDDITVDIMDDKNYKVISASIPVWNYDKFYIIPVEKLEEKLTSLGIDFQLVVIGRDRNILTVQQTRLRGGPSWGTATQYIRRVKSEPFFVSTELLYLYGPRYLQSISKLLDFPIAYDDPRLADIIKIDENEKYITYAENPDIDAVAKAQPTPEEVAAKYEHLRAKKEAKKLIRAGK